MRHSASALLVAVAVAVAVSGCSLLRDGQRSHYTLRANLAVEDPAFYRSVDNFGSVMVRGNAAALLEDGDGVFLPMLEDIRQSKRSVNFETYIYKDDEAGRLFTDALIAAARRGVEVRLMPDAQGSRLGKHRDELTAGGVIVRDYRPAKEYNILGRRTHRKLLIVDGKIGYTGGFCVDKRWLGKARDKSEWHDSSVRVTGPVVAQMQAIFSEDWTYTTGEILAGERFYPKVEPVGSMAAAAMSSSKSDASSLPKMLYFMAIQAATKRIYIQNPYFLPDRQIREGLIEAAKRGIDVRVMVPGPHMDIPPVRSASRHDFGSLLAAGVKIFEYQPTMIHSKVLVVDGIFSTIGSINLDALSMSKNAEAGVSFYDREFAKAVEAMFERDMKRSQPVTHEAWKHRGVLTRFFELCSRSFRPLY